jgi:hypothetical protein
MRKRAISFCASCGLTFQRIHEQLLLRAASAPNPSVATSVASLEANLFSSLICAETVERHRGEYSGSDRR